MSGTVALAGALALLEHYDEEMRAVSLEIHGNPEIGLEEVRAAALLADTLQRHGFVVERGLGSLPTAFRAVSSHGRVGRGSDRGPRAPRIAFLTEYDALPGIGHGCGHNLVGTGSVFAAIALNDLLKVVPREIVVLGTPAEENKGGKITLLEEGYFEGVDAALMSHPASFTEIGRGGRAITSVSIDFEGRDAHSSNPARGINALTGVIQVFNGLDAIIQSLPANVNTNGIITEGGVADNVIPGRAACQFSVRGDTKADVETAVARLLDVVRGAEAVSGAKASVEVDAIYAERRNNMTLERRYAAYLEAQGETVKIADPTGRFGSSDIGNISLRMPAMHPYYRITDDEDPPGAHSKEYADMAASSRAHAGMVKSAAAMAVLGYDLLTDRDFLAEVVAEFRDLGKE